MGLAFQVGQWSEIRTLGQLLLILSFFFGNFLLWDLLRGLLSFELELQQGHSLRQSNMHEYIDKYIECTRDDMNDMVQCIYIYILNNMMTR